MKLVITVTDEDSGQTTTVETADEKSAAGTSEKTDKAVTNGHAEIETFDGGSVPEMLLSMESEVAAGLRRAPGQSF